MREAMLDDLGPERAAELVPYQGAVGEELEPYLQPGLFGPSAVLLDLDGEAIGKPLLARLAASPVRFLILDAQATPARAHLYRELGEYRDCPEPKRGARVAWVRSRARQLGVQLSQEAAVWLAERVDQLAVLNSEISKLALLGRGTYDRNEVQRWVAADYSGDAFSVIEQVLAGQPQQALGELELLLGSGEDPLKVLGALSWQLQLMVRTLAVVEDTPPDRAVRPADVARRLGVKEFPAKRALQAVRGRTEDRMYRDMCATLRCELRIKSGCDPRSQLSQLVVQLALHR